MSHFLVNGVHILQKEAVLKTAFKDLTYHTCSKIDEKPYTHANDNKSFGDGAICTSKFITPSSVVDTWKLKIKGEDVTMKSTRTLMEDGKHTKVDLWIEKGKETASCQKMYVLMDETKEEKKDKERKYGSKLDSLYQM